MRKTHARNEPRYPPRSNNLGTSQFGNIPHASATFLFTEKENDNLLEMKIKRLEAKLRKAHKNAKVDKMSYGRLCHST
jgi:hypothetical protein